MTFAFWSTPGLSTIFRRPSGVRSLSPYLKPFTPGGLPVGIQIVGRRRKELELLQFAHAFEQATRVGERHPNVAV